MKAVTIQGFDSGPALSELPEPEPAGGEVLVRVHASSVNGVDVYIAAGGLREMVEHEFPVVLGRDFAGVVEQVGSSAGRYQAGDRAFGFVLHANPTVRDGSWTELIALPENFLAHAPHSLDLAHAGAAPLAGLTAVAAFDALEPGAGQTVLVLGATGGVGSFFVQLAAAAGATVIAPARPDDHDYLRGLGASELVDRDGDLAAAVRDLHPDGVDAILDAVSFSPDPSLLGDGGRLASPLGAAGDGPGRFNLVADPAPAKLERLAGLLDAGTLDVPIQRSYDLEEAAEALHVFGAHKRGKLALAIVT